MNSIRSIKQQAKKAYKFDIARNAGVEFIAFIVKFAIIFTIATAFIISLTKLGSFAVSSTFMLVICAVFLLLYLLVTAPLNLGRDRYFARVADKIQPETDELFHFFRNMKPAVYCYFRILIAVIFYTVLFTAVTIVYFKIYLNFSTNYFSLLNFLVCASIAVLYITSIVVTMLKYSLVPVVYNISDSSGAAAIVSKSLRLSQGAKSGLFLLHLSFIGWYLLGFLSLGIGFIWIKPYIRIATKIYLNEYIK